MLQHFKILFTGLAILVVLFFVVTLIVYTVLFYTKIALFIFILLVAYISGMIYLSKFNI